MKVVKEYKATAMYMRLCNMTAHLLKVYSSPCMHVVQETLERSHNPSRRLPIQSKHSRRYGCEYG